MPGSQPPDSRSAVRPFFLDSRVGGGALARWPPSASHTARADFPHAAFTKTHDLRGKEKGNYQVDLSYLRQVESSLQYPRTMMYGFFAKRTDPPSSSLLFWLPASSFLPSPTPFPHPLCPPIARSRDFPHASGTIWQSDY